MKKYPFNGIGDAIPYICISLVLLGIFILTLFADEFILGATIAFGAFTTIVLSWAILMLFLRIEIDFDKQQLFMVTPYFIKRINFDEIERIKIIYVGETFLEFTIKTKKYEKSFKYMRYYKRRPNDKIRNKLNELRMDLHKISEKNY